MLFLACCARARSFPMSHAVQENGDQRARASPSGIAHHADSGGAAAATSLEPSSHALFRGLTAWIAVHDHEGAELAALFVQHGGTQQRFLADGAARLFFSHDREEEDTKRSRQAHRKSQLKQTAVISTCPHASALAAVPTV